eukprot:g3207.t1
MMGCFRLRVETLRNTFNLCKQLQYLNLSQTYVLTLPLFSQLRALANLENLHLENAFSSTKPINMSMDDAVFVFQKMRKLKVLGITGTVVENASGCLRFLLKRCTRLRAINVDWPEIEYIWSDVQRDLPFDLESLHLCIPDPPRRNNMNRKHMHASYSSFKLNPVDSFRLQNLKILQLGGETGITNVCVQRIFRYLTNLETFGLYDADIISDEAFINIGYLDGVIGIVSPLHKDRIYPVARRFVSVEFIENIFGNGTKRERGAMVLIGTSVYDKESKESTNDKNYIISDRQYHTPNSLGYFETLKQNEIYEVASHCFLTLPRCHRFENKWISLNEFKVLTSCLDSQRSLQLLCPRKPCLREVILVNCPRLTDVTVRRILTRNQPFLETLTISGLPMITENAFVIEETLDKTKQECPVNGMINFDISNCRNLSAMTLPLVAQGAHRSLHTLSLEDFPDWSPLSVRLLFHKSYSFKALTEISISNTPLSWKIAKDIIKSVPSLERISLYRTFSCYKNLYKFSAILFNTEGAEDVECLIPFSFTADGCSRMRCAHLKYMDILHACVESHGNNMDDQGKYLPLLQSVLRKQNGLQVMRCRGLTDYFCIPENRIYKKDTHHHTGPKSKLSLLKRKHKITF